MASPPTKKPPEPAALTLSCPARLKELHAALDAIERACNSWKIDRSLVSRARIVVEELFSNTIKYGYGGECERPVRLNLRPNPELTLVYEDEAPPFNPLNWKADETLAPEKRPPGLAGIAMVMKLSSTTSYRRRGDTNCLTISFAKKP